MWFFDWFRDNFNQAASWLNDTGSRADSIPVLGPYFSYPFYQLANVLYSLASAAGSASTWSNSVYADAGRVFSDIRSSIASTWPLLQWSAGTFVSWIRSSAESVWPALTRTGYDWFQQLRAYCTETWSILADTRASLWSYITGQCTSTWSILTASGYDLFGRIRSYCDQTWSILGWTQVSLWSWITSGPLQQQLETWMTGQQDLVTGWIKGQLHYFIEQGFLVLDNSWSSFTGSFTWLLDKLIALMLDQAGHFADPLWQLLEAVLKNIQDKR